MDLLPRLSDQLNRLDVQRLVPQFTANFFPCSQITPQATTTPQVQPTKPSLELTFDTNPFYHQDLTFEATAKHMYKIILAASEGCDAWLAKPDHKLQALAHLPQDQNPLARMCQDINHILFFLDRGRKGCDLTFLPDNFFSDVETLLATLPVKLLGLSEKAGAEFLLREGMVKVEDLRYRLEEIKALRAGIWMQSKMVHEGMEAAGAAKGMEEMVLEQASDLQTQPASATPTSLQGDRALFNPGPQFGDAVNLDFGEKVEFTAGRDSLLPFANFKQAIEGSNVEQVANNGAADRDKNQTLDLLKDVTEQDCLLFE